MVSKCILFIWEFQGLSKAVLYGATVVTDPLLNHSIKGTKRAGLALGFELRRVPPAKVSSEYPAIGFVDVFRHLKVWNTNQICYIHFAQKSMNAPEKSNIAKTHTLFFSNMT